MSLKVLSFMEKNITPNHHKEEGNKEQDDLVKEFDSKTVTNNSMKVAVIFIVMIVFGVGSGFLIARTTTGGSASSTDAAQIESGEDITVGKTYGSDDTETFSDTAEGDLEKGGIEGEGQYHLERPGGETQYVYLTSSVVDLGLMEGRKIKVWGSTQKAQYAPWLMDVGRVEVLE